MQQLSFLKNLVGNVNSKGKFSHSLKKFAFLLSVLTAYIAPTIMLLLNVITGEQWLSFYKIIIPATVTVYTAGKWVDNKNGK